MKIGDLVKKQNSYEPSEVGVVLDIMEDFEHALVQPMTSLDGSLWVNFDRLEVINAVS